MDGSSGHAHRPQLHLYESDTALSTRGSHLPGLIQSRSSATLSEMRKSSKKRPNTLDRSITTDRLDDEESLSRSSIEDEPRHFHLGLEALEAPFDFPLTRAATNPERNRKISEANAKILMAPQIRSQRLIGNSNPRYRWEQYYKSEEELKQYKKPIRKYYERNNYLVQQYLYIDRLLDSSLPHNLIQDYDKQAFRIPPTIQEEPTSLSSTPAASTPPVIDMELSQTPNSGNGTITPRVQRNKNLYKVPDEETPLLHSNEENSPSTVSNPTPIPTFEPEEEVSSNDRVVAIAIYTNLAANAALLIMKIIVTVLTSSLSVLASLVDAALDFLSTFIVWTTTFLIAKAAYDSQNYPAGRRRLEPVGVLVFSIVMITAFAQVAIEAIQRLSNQKHEIVELTVPAIAIMLSTVVIKGFCWFYCRLIKNSSVQALAQDAVTDVVFNAFSIVFPLVGFYARLWWLDPLGGLILPIYVIVSWSFTARTHILNLTGKVASADQRNILLYLTMRFAHTVKKIQSLAAYHAGDQLMVEVDIVVDHDMPLRDSHDLGESLQYVLESVPGVERAFVHTDYLDYNLPSHMQEVNK